MLLAVKFLSVFSDHGLVNLIMGLCDIFSHRPRLWRLNLDLLEDETLCAQVEKLLKIMFYIKSLFPPFMTGGTF